MSEQGYWQRRTTRRQTLRGAALGGLGMAAFLAGCSGSNNNKSKGASTTTSAPSGGNATSAPATQAALPTLTVRPTAAVDESKINKNNVYRDRQSQPWPTINPYKDLITGLTLGFTIYDHMWYTTKDTNERVLFLATGIEQPDPLHFTVKIGKAVFHDKPPTSGRAVTAADIKASYEAAAKSKTISNSDWWTKTLDTITTPDDSTVSFTLKQPDAWTFTSTNAGSPLSGSIIPQEIATQPDFMDKDLIGSGRYQWVSHENGANPKMKRFDKWRVAGEPWTGGYEQKLIQEQAAADAAFAAQQIDHLAAQNKAEKDQLVSQLGKQVDVDTTVTGAIWTVETRADGAFADPRVRQAIYLGLNRDEYIQLLELGNGVKSGPIPPGFKTFALDNDELTKTFWQFDPAQGKQLLQAAGFDLSHEYEIKYYILTDKPAQFAQIVQGQLQKNLGMKVKLTAEDFGTWLAKSLYQGQYDGFIIYPTLDYDDPSSYIGAYGKVIGGRPNWAGFKDDELDQAVAAQKLEFDDGKRTAMLKDIQRKAYQKFAPFIPLYVAFSNDLFWSYVKGRLVGRGSYGLFNGRLYIDK
ncbi:MAG TPA: ABC transporter substrate-binding protein [Dehalococcoidia bacterium]|nr:ABC transporter substrate-binding protein [Dehalococcoidia bacterium]